MKDCDYSEDPVVYIKVSRDSVHGFTDDVIKKITLKVMNTSFEPVDSFRVFQETEDFTTHEPLIMLNGNFLTHGEGTTDLNQFYYIFYNDSTMHADTLKDLYYKFNSSNIDCNTCFPFGSGDAIQTIINNFTGIFNSRLHNLKSDTLLIQR